MAFEQRNSTGPAYFYLSVRDRETGRVRKTYYGHGPQATAAASALEARRTRREAERRAAQEAEDETRDLDGLMADLDSATDLLMEAVLLAAGWHRMNYGPWRRRKHGHGRHTVDTALGGTG